MIFNYKHFLQNGHRGSSNSNNANTHVKEENDTEYDAKNLLSNNEMKMSPSSQQSSQAGPQPAQTQQQQPPTACSPTSEVVH